MTILLPNDGKNRIDDYDFNECMKYAPFKIDDVKEIIACSPGEADGDPWEYICELKDGNFGYVTGSCDYTGWGCQEGGDGSIHTTVDGAILAAPEDTRATLSSQVNGTQPYGLITY